MDVRVLIIDDHKLFAEALRSTLERHEMEVLPVTGSGVEGLEAVERSRPDLVIVDLRLHDMDGLEVGKKILENHPETRILAVTGVDDPATLREAIRVGFHGFLTKDTPVRQLVASIRAVVEGQVVMPRSLARAASGAQTSEEREASLLADQLTARERTVLRLLVEGASSRQIAEALSVSPNTVRTHVQNILMKLHVHSRLEAVAFAVRHGIVKVPGSRGLGQ